MKKQLLFMSFALGSFLTSNAQLLQSENFNTFTIGNIGTDITGAVAGQGGFLTQATAGGTNANNSNFQIIASDATRVKAVQITGSNAATGSRFLWKDGLDTAWTGRTTGNNVIELEFSFNTGPATTSTSTLRGIIFSTTGTIGGYSFNAATKVLSGFAFGDFNNTGTPGNYNITLKTGGLILPANTWVKVGFAYDTVTGLFTWVCNDVTPAVAGTIQGAPGYIPTELDVFAAAGTLNAVAPVFVFDDYTVRATPEENLLSTTKFITENDINIYPNPVNDIVNISLKNNIALTGITIMDIDGRIIKNNLQVLNNQINISDLSSGIYLMKLNSDNGSIVKKIVKK